VVTEISARRLDGVGDASMRESGDLDVRLGVLTLPELPADLVRLLALSLPELKGVVDAMLREIGDFFLGVATLSELEPDCAATNELLDELRLFDAKLEELAVLDCDT